MSTLGPNFIDTTTLSSFALVGRLDLLRRSVEGHPPHWTEAIQAEVRDGVEVGRAGFLRAVLDAPWLGEPWAPTGGKDRKAVFRLQVGLNDGRQPPTQHGGEAESLYACEVTGGSFVTDDGPAGDFGRRRGIRVRDTVDVLQDAVALASATAEECWSAVEAMLDAGRTIRRGKVTADDFG